MRVIIAGTRTIHDAVEVSEAIRDSGFRITEVVCGGASGVDTLGKQWAERHGIPVKMFPADWGAYGLWAGPKRNAEMAEYAEALILVWDGKSKGSANMLKNALKRGIAIHEVITT